MVGDTVEKKVKSLFVWGITFGLLSFLMGGYVYDTLWDRGTELKSKAEIEIEMAEKNLVTYNGKSQLALAYYARYEETGDDQFLIRAATLMKSVDATAIPARDYLLGVFHLELKEEEEALKYLENYLHNNPQHQEVQISRGTALIKLKRYEEAIKALTVYAKIKPGIAETYELLGQAYQELGREEQAKEVRLKANQLLGKK